jgi:hypothetical protein
VSAMLKLSSRVVWDMAIIAIANSRKILLVIIFFLDIIIIGGTIPIYIIKFFKNVLCELFIFTVITPISTYSPPLAFEPSAA